MMENTPAKESMHGNTCRCIHHKMIPLYILLFGLVFLLGNLGMVGEEFVSLAWPILVMLTGIQKMCESWCKCC